MVVFVSLVLLLFIAGEEAVGVMTFAPFPSVGLLPVAVPEIDEAGGDELMVPLVVLVAAP